MRAVAEGLDLLTDRVDLLTERVDAVAGRVDGLTDRVGSLETRFEGFQQEIRREFAETQAMIRLSYSELPC